MPEQDAVAEIRLKKLAVFFMKVILKGSSSLRHLMKGAFEGTLSGGLCGLRDRKEKGAGRWLPDSSLTAWCVCVS
jgi:hypothetical protein